MVRNDASIAQNDALRPILLLQMQNFLKESFFMLSKKWCAQFLDGTLTDHKAYVSGRYRGYNVVCYETNGKSTQIVNISASSEGDSNCNELKTFMNTLLPLYKQFKDATADEHSLTLTFVVGTPKKFVEIANDIVGRIIRYLAQNGYTSGCANCGLSGEALYLVNDHYMWLCSECAAKYQSELEERKVNAKTQSSNLVGGLVGAFLGALIGSVLYVVVYQLGYIAGVCGFVMAVLALKFYEKLGGCLDLKGVIASIVVVMIMVFVSNKLAWSWSAYSALKDSGWTFFDCFRELDYIIETLELKGSYTSDLVVGFLISAIGCVRSFINAVKGSTGSFTFKKLES